MNTRQNLLDGKTASPAESNLGGRRGGTTGYSRKGWLVWMFLAMLLFAVGCSSNGDGETDESSALNEPPTTAGDTGETEKKNEELSEEDLAVIKAEEEAKRIQDDEEARAKAEDERIAKEKEYQATYTAAVLKEFGTVAERKMKPRTEVQPTGIPFDEAFPRVPDEATLNIGILSASTEITKGKKVAALIGDHERVYLERMMGRPLHILFITHTDEEIGDKTVIQFRPEYVHAAMELAALLPNEQKLEPMPYGKRDQKDVHLLLYVAESYK